MYKYLHILFSTSPYKISAEDLQKDYDFSKIFAWFSEASTVNDYKMRLLTRYSQASGRSVQFGANACDQLPQGPVFTCMYVCMYVYMYVCKHV